ncbi:MULTISPECIES: hypothetical protein [unclassified Myxococcus]|jgi:hypothetical protein|uniref:hypothetical protein n=1 Tax=unclassified Myxococcus TaxID=2648731 RepID=UPI001CC09882|nr:MULTISPECIES: hypothetical protein [unclassified Myxococcus]MBZ4402395.1 hypothetical protein [Myxococcus sp. AS-1-15]MBZ4412461.1 hypothetical protein [Myxococcus sp. XM-1-1-1]BDT33796.1 hypothetical protein MFMH1_34650 [Myxococcus sp. MH1]
MGIPPKQRQDPARGGLDVIKATRQYWLHNEKPVKDGRINVTAGSTHVLLFMTAHDLGDARIQLRTQGFDSRPPVDLFVPKNVPIPDFLPAGQYTITCQFRDVLAGEITGTLNVGMGTEEPRGNSHVNA